MFAGVCVCFYRDVNLLRYYLSVCVQVSLERVELADASMLSVCVCVCLEGASMLMCVCV